MSFQVAFLRDSPPPLCTTRRRLRAKPTGSAWDGEMPRPCGHVWGGITTATATAFHCISAQVTKCDNLEMFILHSSKYFFFKDILCHTEFVHQLFNSSLKMLSWNQDLLKILEGSERVTKGGCDRSLITQTRFAPRIRTIPFFTLCRFVWYFMWDAFSNDAWGLGRSSQRDAKAESMIKLHQCINDPEEYKEVTKDCRTTRLWQIQVILIGTWKGSLAYAQATNFSIDTSMQHSPQIYGPVKSILNKSWEFAKSGSFHGRLVTATISVWLGPKSPLIAVQTAVATLTSRPRLYDYIGFAKRNLNTVSMLFRIECVMICIFLAWGRSSVAGRTWWKPKGSFCRVIGCY